MFVLLALSVAALPALARSGTPLPPEKLTCAAAAKLARADRTEALQTRVELVHRALEQRRFVMPPSREAGEMLSEMIDRECQRAPGMLLAKAVDRSVEAALGN